MGIPIFYGSRLYCRKIVPAGKIGVPVPPEHIKQFEFIQLYGHLYWIPMFPMGNSWIARGKDGKSYEVGEELELHLKETYHSWYSILLAFSGPILLLVFLGLYIAYDAYKVHQSEVYAANETMRRQNERLAYITHPAIDDYYYFSESNSSANALVTGYNDTAIQLALLPVNLNREALPQVIGMLTDTSFTNKDWISKRTLIAITNERNRTVIPLLGAGSFYVGDITRLGEPTIEYGGYGSTEETFTALVRNKGKNLIITAIDQKRADVSSKDSLPYFWEYMQYAQFNMKRERGKEFRFTFTCEDEKGKRFRYMVNGNQGRDPGITITRQ